MFVIQTFPLHLIKATFGINFKFYSNLDFDDSKIPTFLSFYLFILHSFNFSITGASTFVSLLLFHFPFYHKQFGKTKILK